MADNFSVRSPSSGGAGAVAAAAKKPKVDKGAEEIARLKQLAKTRSGRNVSDTQLRNIVERRKARKAHKTRIDNTKAEFETEQASEKLGDKSLLRQAQKTIGAKAAKSHKDGLTAEDHKSISSDPDAGPKLPPTMAKPASPEQAKKLLISMLDNVEIGGEPLDLEVYAKTLKKMPPTRPKEAPRQQKSATQQHKGGLTKAAGQVQTQAPGHKAPLATQQAAQTSLGQKQVLGQKQAPEQRLPAGAGAKTATPAKSVSMTGLARQGTTMTGRGGPGTTGSGTRAGEPGPRMAPGGPGPGMTPGAPGMAPGAGLAKSVAAMSAGVSENPSAMPGLSSHSAAANTGKRRPSGNSWNAGGGLLSDTGSWDGMNFNWDGFFSLFMIRSQKDLGEWKRAMRELRQASLQAELAGHDLAIQMQKMRDELKRIKSAMDFGKAISSAADKFSRELDKARANAVAGEQPALVAEVDQEIKNSIAKLAETHPELKGRLYLSKSQLEELKKTNPKEAEELESLFAKREEYGGPATTIGLIDSEIERQRWPQPRGAQGPPAPVENANPSLLEDKVAAESRLDAAMKEIGSDEEAWVILTHRRRQFSQHATEVSRELHSARQELDAPPTAEQQEKVWALEAELESTFRTINTLDRVFAQQRPRTPDSDEHMLEAVHRSWQTVADSKNPLEILVNKPKLAGQIALLPPGLLAESLVRDEAALTTARSENNSERVTELTNKIDITGSIMRYGENPSTTTELSAQRASLADITEAKARLSGAVEEYQKYRADNPKATLTDLEMRRLDNAVLQRGDQLLAITGSPLAELQAKAEAGNRLFNVTTDLEPGKLETMLKTGAGAMYAGAEKMEGFINEGPWVQAVDKSIGLALGLARKQRKATQGQLRQVVSKSQGMINQLIQVIGMSRSR